MSTTQVSKARLWASYILQGMVIIMFLMGATFNLMQTEEAVAGATEMGYRESSVFLLGVILLLSTILFAIPRTAVYGAILLTGWLGGAVATHIIHDDPLFNTVFPVIVGVVVWFSLWLRDDRVQNLVR